MVHYSLFAPSIWRSLFTTAMEQRSAPRQCVLPYGVTLNKAVFKGVKSDFFFIPQTQDKIQGQSFSRPVCYFSDSLQKYSARPTHYKSKTEKWKVKIGRKGRNSWNSLWGLSNQWWLSYIMSDREYVLSCSLQWFSVIFPQRSIVSC